VTCATRRRHADGQAQPFTEDGAVHIATDSPARDDVRRLLDEHLTDMFATSPAESVHALDHSALLAPAITFWTARDDDGTLLGCGALKELEPGTGPDQATGPGQGQGASRGEAHREIHAEIKSMRTTAHARGRGVASALLTIVLAEARRRGYARVSLETGSQDYFAPARRLYARHGFTECGPFGDYTPDPHSVFMTLELTAPRTAQDDPLQDLPARDLPAQNLPR
jgi:putative acetyltransferase